MRLVSARKRYRLMPRGHENQSPPTLRYTKVRCVEDNISSVVPELSQRGTELMNTLVRGKTGNILHHDRTWPEATNEANELEEEIFLGLVPDYASTIPSTYRREALTGWTPSE